MNRIRAVLFDMDGVLIDARDWHFEALNEALSVFGYSITEEMHIDRYDGLPTMRKLEMLHNECGLPTHLSKIINKVKQDKTLRIAAQKCFPNPAHLVLVSKLKEEGIKLGVVTNSIRQTTEFMLTYAGLINFFDVITTNQDVKHAKPNPECYLRTIQNLEVRPEETLIIEDSDYGVEAAKASQANVIKVSGVEEVNLELLLQSNFRIFND